MIEEIIKNDVIFSLIAVFGIVGFLLLLFLAIKLHPGGDNPAFACSFSALCMIFLFVGFFSILKIGSKSQRILVEEIVSGVYLDQYGEPVKAEIPKKVLKIYETRFPQNSGYAVRKWKWVYRIGMDDLNNEFRLDAKECNVIHFRSEGKAILGDGRRFLLPRDIKTVTQYTSADSWWSQKNPRKIQNEVEFLVWPKKETHNARVVRIIFRS